MKIVLNYYCCILMRGNKSLTRRFPTVQYRDELINVASSFFEENNNKRESIMNQIQLHAINQIKDGFTSFRISRLKKDDEKYLKEWADMTNANVKVIKFRCFENQKKYLVKQFVVDLKGSINIDYELEGKTLVL